MLYNVFELGSKSLEQGERIFQPVSGFFQKYFWNGIKYDLAYNWIDTLTYALIFVGAAWLLYDRFFKTKKILINREFIIALSGWIVFGSAMRASEDAGIFKSVLLVTPLHYITIFAIAFPTLLLSLYFNKRVPYWKSWGALGYFLGALALVQLPLKNLYGVSIILGVWAAWIFVFWIIKRVFLRKKESFFSRWNFATLSAQMFDASSTFVALTFFSNFWEKHVLGSTLMAFFESRNILLVNGSASWIMFALKLLVVPVVLNAIDRYAEEDNEKRFLKMIILLLGLAVGLRNTLEVGMFA
ncbi:Uncharacterised protein [uncultured archaeon]|nr:Uncharacterised protein [uncultured archaeon]